MVAASGAGYGYIFQKRVDISIISIMVMGDASDTIKYDRRASELSNAPLHMKQDTTSTPV